MTAVKSPYVDLILVGTIMLLLAVLVYRHWTFGSVTQEQDEGLGIKELIRKVKEELVQADQAGAGEAALFQLKDFELELNFIVKSRSTESGAIEYSVITVGGETEVSSERVQRIKLRMDAAIPRKGRAVGSSPSADDARNAVTVGPIPPSSPKEE